MHPVCAKASSTEVSLFQFTPCSCNLPINHCPKMTLQTMFKNGLLMLNLFKKVVAFYITSIFRRVQYFKSLGYFWKLLTNSRWLSAKTCSKLRKGYLDISTSYEVSTNCDICTTVSHLFLQTLK